MAEYKSKTVTVNATAKTIFEKASDVQGVIDRLPDDKKTGLSVVDGVLCLDYAGFSIKIKTAQATPYSKLVYTDVDAPFHFSITIDLEPAELVTQTLLTVSVDAELNLMMKMMLGNKIKEILDQTVTAISTGEFQL